MAFENALKAGSTLQDGRFVVGRVLGQGGFGITYEAEQALLGKRVALKEFFLAHIAESAKVTFLKIYKFGVFRGVFAPFHPPKS